MRQSHLFTKTRREAPKDEVAKNAQLLIRAGFIDKELAGAYSYLPLGLRVANKVMGLIREEINAIDGQELLLTSLQGKNIWEKTDRWDEEKVDVWFKSKDGDYGFAWSHEEPIANMMTHHVNSYKDLPVYAYQFQKKFRNETRAKSGLLRGREFFMKDLYSFNKDEEGLDSFYDKCIEAYKRIFDRVGIGDITYLTYASGEPFTEFSHEFQTLSEVGEDIIYLDEKKKVAINKEVYNDKTIKDADLKKDDLVERKSIEVGNIFKFGTKKSEALGLSYKDEEGLEQYVVLGSYGIGIGRLIATIVETLSDDKGLIWPDSIAPFKVHLIELEKGLGKELYEKLNESGVEVLYDDRELTPGEKFNDADLIGIPWRYVVSNKTDGKVECKRRGQEKVEILKYDKSVKKLL